MISRITLFMLLCVISFQAVSQEMTTDVEKNISTESAVLFTNSWNLAELNGISTLQPGVKQAYLTFQLGEFNYIRMTGFSGCNFIGGRINLQARNGIVFHPDLLTNENCAGSSVESPLLEALALADNWSEKNGQLLLQRKGKVLAKWNPASYANPNLHGTWQLMFLEGLIAPFSAIYPPAICPGLTFTNGQSVATGYSGCHEYNVPFILNQETLVFRGSTACDTTCRKDPRNIFLETLHSVNAYYFKDDKILVLVNGSRPVMAFTRMKNDQVLPVASNRG